MAVNFPDNPSNGQTVTFGSTTYTYNSTKSIWTSGSSSSTNTDNYLEVANSVVFVTKADAVASNNAIKVLIDDRLQVANLQPQLDKYLQVANSTSLASEKVFTVTNDGSSAYKFYGVGTGADASQANSNPTLYLSRGEKYTFSVNASGHPFYINTTNTTGTGNAFANGVINNGAQVGNVEFTVPMNAPDTLHYNCQYHSSMNGTIYVLSQTSTDTSSFQTKADATTANNALLSLIQDRLQVANLQPQLDKYLQVANGISLTAFDIITTAPSGNGSLIYTSANGSFTFTPANATQGGGGGGASVTISDVAPSSPSAGDMWFDSEDLILYVYYNDGSSSQWVKSSPSGISAANVNWVEKTSNTTITAGEKYILDTSSALTVTLPASASIGDEIKIIDGTGNAATNNITIGRNGHKIQGSAADMVIDVNRAAFGLVYYNATHGWVLTEK
jgi:plastocyanin